ncbi:MAG TPA: GatB/YqeY domain-containing protein [Bryobacteraceae bacterium]|nr:GatB/YqeY domain-containing protein [Bryobacteraceae bacterium]
MPLLERLQADLVAAMKAKDEARLGTIRMMKSALKKHEIDSMKPLDEGTELQVMNMLVKQRRESAEAFRNGGREELAEKEEAELALIETYMPQSATDEEIERAINDAVAETQAAGPKGMGLVMKAVGAKLAGKRVDNRVVSDRVKARLG